MLKHFFSLFLVGIHLCLTTAAGINPKLEDIPLYDPNLDDTQCGGIIDAEIDQQIGLQYKTLVNFNTNERCVWIIRAPNATGYDYELIYAGYQFPNKYHGVSISSLYPTSHHGDNLVDIPVTPRLGVRGGVAGSVIVITFHSSDYPYPYNGFLLSLTPGFTPTGLTSSSLSVNYITDSTFSSVRHPSSTRQYSPNDTSVFVFTTGNTYDAAKTLNVVYSKDGVESGDSCPDHLFAYTFNMSKDSTYKWSDPKKICGSEDVALTTNNDLIMVVFRSDGINNGEGFRLTHTTTTSSCI